MDGRRARHRTAPRWPGRVATRVSDCRSHTRSSQSREAETRERPATFRPYTVPECARHSITVGGAFIGSCHCCRWPECMPQKMREP